MHNKKDERFFLVLLFLTLTGMAVLAFSVWYLQVAGINELTRLVLTVLSLVLSLVFLLLFVGFGTMIVTLAMERPVAWLAFPTRLALQYLFPLALYLGGLLGIPRDNMQRAYIQLSNRLVSIKGIAIKGTELLILLPHCIQKADCPYKVTNDVENCRRCGRCTINDLLRLKEKYGCHLAVATGGTLARKVVKELRPKAIIAVACERDLSSGIQDTYPMPVTGVLNIRPEGPCINTLVDVKQVEKAILQFIEKE